MTTFKRKFNFEKNIMVKVSKNIKKYRLIACITQEQLAVDIGKSNEKIEYKKGEIGCSIDTSIYKIYLYDDKMIITFTTNNNKNVDFPSSDEMLSTFEGAIAPP